MPRPERAAVRAVLKASGLEPELQSSRVARAAEMTIQEPDWSDVEPTVVVGDMICKVVLASVEMSWS